jgi:hypothetical protein
MQNQQQLAVVAPLPLAFLPDRTLGLESGGFEGSPSRKRQCTQKCLKMVQGLTS